MNTLLNSYSNYAFEAGCDEAGRGCLAGSVFAAAVIFPKTFESDLINDSKKLSEKKRLRARDIIIKNALAWSVVSIDIDIIEKINILNASILGMHKAIGNLALQPEFILVDGNRFKNYLAIPHKCVIGGDALYQSIAAASILAKTARDEYMEQLSNEYPQYNWKKNKGYATAAHRKAIEEFGPSIYHRKSFLSNIFQKKLLF